MDCDEETDTLSEVEGSTGLCGRCPRSRERLGLGPRDSDGLDDFDPVVEDRDD
jgi:hypothetical protein